MWSILKNKLSFTAPDDKQLYAIRRDYTGGQNTRTHPNRIGENQAEALTNWDIGTPAQLVKRKGSVLISDDMGSASVLGLHNYIRQGYTDALIAFEDDNANDITSEGNHAEIKGNFTASQTDIGFVQAKESGLTPDDVVFINVGGNNWWRLHKASNDAWATQDLGNTAGTGTDSPPASTVGAWYGNRFWVLVNDLLYFSAAYSADYSSAFDTVSDVYRIPVGEERAIIPVRDTGMIIAGEQAIWGLAASATPVATDKPEPMVTSHGFVSKKGWCQVADDIFYFAQDGLRSLQKTQQDKLQQKTSYPISYGLKEEFEAISWAYIDRLCMVYFDNKLFITVPTGAATFSTWVYYPATNSFMIIDGWSPRCYAVHKISGEDRMYYGLHGDGKVYRGWYGYTDQGTSTTNGTAITATLEGRQEDFGQPLVKKRGGEVEIEAFSSGDDATLTIKASVDDQADTTLGTLSLQSDTAPTLPVDLPFNLSDSYMVRDKFSLDSLGEFRNIQITVENSDENTEDVKLYGINIITFGEEYQNE